MADLRFDGRVAVITGAGRGLGRAYALLLAARGARIVVNDPGASLSGDASDEAPADEVVRAIRQAGGEAVASTASVATPEGGQAIVQAAIDAFGRIDILIHNAGIVRKAPLAEMTCADFEDVLDVHLRGAFHVVRPAFPLMCAAGHGRIVLTGSVNGLYGNYRNAGYSVAKAGTLGLCNVAALEGAAHGVTCNMILPAAVTRMSEGIDTSQFPPMPPEMVAPAVAWLCHETCPITGEMIVSAAGRIARAYIAETPGVYRPDWTIEAVAAAAAAIRDTSDPLIFSPVPWGQLDHLKYGFAMAAGG